jgi:ribosome recycling factor
MAFNFKTFDERGKETVNWLSKEYNSIRTGQASPALLDGIQVESYGAKVPLNQVGSVGIEDSRTLRISPWSPDSIVDIEKAILESDLGVSVATDSSGLRVIFPELTSERRVQLLKLAKSKLEEARVSLRGARDEAVKHIEQEEKTGDLSEDERYDAKEEMQKKMDERNKELDTMFAAKESEINQ